MNTPRFAEVKHNQLITTNTDNYTQTEMKETRNNFIDKKKDSKVNIGLEALDLKKQNLQLEGAKSIQENNSILNPFVQDEFESIHRYYWV